MVVCTLNKIATTKGKTSNKEAPTYLSIYSQCRNSMHHLCTPLLVKEMDYTSKWDERFNYMNPRHIVDGHRPAGLHLGAKGIPKFLLPKKFWLHIVSSIVSRITKNMHSIEALSIPKEVLLASFDRNAIKMQIAQLTANLWSQKNGNSKIWML